MLCREQQELLCLAAGEDAGPTPQLGGVVQAPEYAQSFPRAILERRLQEQLQHRNLQTQAMPSSERHQFQLVIAEQLQGSPQLDQ
jgi:hypothetical protein